MIYLSDAAIHAGIVAGLEADNAAKDKRIKELEAENTNLKQKIKASGREKLRQEVAALTAENAKLRTHLKRVIGDHFAAQYAQDGTVRVFEVTRNLMVELP
jgi:cell division protein FtsB